MFKILNDLFNFKINFALMFFYLSKILLFIIKPLVWIVFLLLFAVFTKDELKRKKRIIFSLLTAFFVSNTVLVNEIGLLFEKENSEISNNQYEIGLVLGGFASFDSALNRTVFYEANDRLMQTLVLYKKGIIKKIMISSGSGSILNQNNKEANAVKLYLENINIPDSAIIIENQSRNTLENIDFSFKIIDSLKIKSKVLVISSAWHLPRVKLCCAEKNVDYFATNYISDRNRKYSIGDFLIPSSIALQHFELLLKEGFGYLTYLTKT